MSNNCFSMRKSTSISLTVRPGCSGRLSVAATAFGTRAGFVTIINEARKYRLFSTLAHQNLEQLDRQARAAAANCGNIVVFRVNPQDSAELGRHFLSNGHVLPANTLSNLPRFHAMVRYADRKQRRQAFVQTFREKGQEDPTVAASIRARSSKLGMPADDIKHYVNDILGRENDKSPEKGRPPIRSKPKTSNDQTG